MSERGAWKVEASAPDVYDRHLVPLLFGPFGGDLVRAAGPRPGERVLDVACGSGAVTQHLPATVGSHGRVVGFDLMPRMLRLARTRIGALGAWVQGNALRLPFRDAAFDVALCQQGLQFFPDRAASLREVHRVLAPNGRAAYALWTPLDTHPAFHALWQALDHHVPDGGAAMRKPYALTSAPEIEGLFRSAGFREVGTAVARRDPSFPSVRAFLEWYVPASPVSTPFAHASPAQRAKVEEELARTAAAADGSVPSPMTTHLVVARR